MGSGPEQTMGGHAQTWLAHNLTVRAQEKAASLLQISRQFESVSKTNTRSDSQRDSLRPGQWTGSFCGRPGQRGRSLPVTRQPARKTSPPSRPPQPDPACAADRPVKSLVEASGASAVADDLLGEAMAAATRRTPKHRAQNSYAALQPERLREAQHFRCV